MALEYISAKKMDYYVGREDSIIVDLRRPAEYKKGHIRGAVNVWYGVIDKKLDEMIYKRRKPRYGDLDGIIDVKIYKNIIFYCERGSLSLAICGKMSRLGYNVKSVVGGLSQYRGRYYEK